MLQPAGAGASAVKRAKHLLWTELFSHASSCQQEYQGWEPLVAKGLAADSPGLPRTPVCKSCQASKAVPGLPASLADRHAATRVDLYRPFMSNPPKRDIQGHQAWSKTREACFARHQALRQPQVRSGHRASCKSCTSIFLRDAKLRHAGRPSNLSLLRKPLSPPPAAGQGGALHAFARQLTSGISLHRWRCISYISRHDERDIDAHALPCSGMVRAASSAEGGPAGGRGCQLGSQNVHGSP